jgi:hypothetical protein
VCVRATKPLCNSCNNLIEPWYRLKSALRAHAESQQSPKSLKTHADAAGAPPPSPSRGTQVFFPFCSSTSTSSSACPPAREIQATHAHTNYGQYRSTMHQWGSLAKNSGRFSHVGDTNIVVWGHTYSSTALKCNHCLWVLIRILCARQLVHSHVKQQGRSSRLGSIGKTLNHALSSLTLLIFFLRCSSGALEQ